MCPAAHVDHGKTTLMDRLLAHCGHASAQERFMDSNVLEKERGITINSKYTSLQHGQYTLNAVDTPGHADFGGEVERQALTTTVHLRMLSWLYTSWSNDMLLRYHIRPGTLLPVISVNVHTCGSGNTSRSPSLILSSTFWRQYAIKLKPLWKIALFWLLCCCE